MKALAKYDAACRAVAAAKTVDEAKHVRDEADRLRLLARQANNRELEIDCAEIRVRAERKLGELLLAAKEAGQVRRGRRGGGKAEAGAAVVLVKLEDVGVDRKLSMQAQRLAAVKQPAFEQLVMDMREDMAARGRRASLDLVGKLQKAERDRTRRADYESRVALGCTAAELEKIIREGYRAGTVYDDPNWEYRTWSAKGSGRSASQHYATAPDKDLIDFAAMVDALAAPNSLFLCWATGPQFPLALQYVAACGFTYQTFGFSWSKLNKTVDAAAPFGVDDFFMGQGHWTRANEEICILATRGKPQRLNADVRQKIIAPLGAHSEKPKIHDRIERLAAGPYIELHARAAVKNWTVWGDEIPRAEFRSVAA